VIIRKTAGEVDTMARAGKVVAGTFDLLEQQARPGISLAELDRLAERYITSHGGVPSFKGYRGFPGSICASPNEMVVHGIPGPYVLADGDLLSLDVGVTLDGYVADSAITVVVGTPAAEALDLIDACYEGLEAAIGQCHAGKRLGDVSHAVQESVEARGYGVVRSLVGHGVGRDMHEDPQIPNYGPAGRGPRLAPGMVFAIEPMITAGSYDVEGGADGWAVFTRDGSLAAHCEHTVAITDNGPRVLTRRDASKQDSHAR
jgi:methionyl aminopeptidase